MFGKLNRGGSTGSEYFLNKTSINYLKDYKQELKRKIKTIIEESGY
jgi:hypothetical protein